MRPSSTNRTDTPPKQIPEPSREVLQKIYQPTETPKTMVRESNLLFRYMESI